MFTCCRGVRLFCVFVVFAAHVLLNAVFSRVLAWFWVDFRKIVYFYDTVFLHFGILDFWRFLLDAGISGVLGWF